MSQSCLKCVSFGTEWDGLVAGAVSPLPCFSAVPAETPCEGGLGSRGVRLGNAGVRAHPGGAHFKSHDC